MNRQVNLINDTEEQDYEDQPGQIIFEKKGNQVQKFTRKTRSKHGGPFRDDLKKLMYGFGDDPNPNEQTLD